MGLLSWFRRNKTDKAVERVMEENGPRPQYYVFAHYVLRDATFELGAACPGILLSDRRDEFLTEMWEHATSGIREHDPSVKTDPYPGVQVIPLRAGSFPCVVLKMPPPKGVTECYCVGIVAHMDLSKDEQPTEQTPMSFFTLEYGVGDDMKTPRTVLCEWSKEGTHSNFGDGPPPEPEMFANAIGQTLAGRGYHRKAAVDLPRQQS
jgi:hypothetical protein